MGTLLFPASQIDTQLVKKDNLTDDVELHYDMRTRRGIALYRLTCQSTYQPGSQFIGRLILTVMFCHSGCEAEAENKGQA